MKLLALLVAALAVASAAATSEEFRGHVVLRVEAVNEAQAEVLYQLEKSGSYDFWTQITIGGPTDIRTPPTGLKDQLVGALKKNGIKFYTMIEDVQALLDAENLAQRAAKAKARSGRQGHNMDFDSYHPIEDMYDYFDYLEANFDYVSTETIGQSYEGEDLRLIKLCKGGCGNKPAMWIDGGIHAREWISPAAVMFMVQELTENLASEDSDLVDNLDWYILPVVNPDGYLYTQNSNRLWRKTRSQHQGDLCTGTDANRNFGYEWNTGGSSGNSCDDTYHGPSAFSEVEAQVVRDFIDVNKNQIKFYMNVHSYSQLILLPWGFTENPAPGFDDLMALATKGNDALYATHQKTYDVGCIPCMLYVASGGSIDWTLGDAGVKYSYGMELRDTGAYGFLLPPDQIIPTGEEMWAFHKVAARDIFAEFGAH